MTIAREDLHALVDRVAAQDLDRAANALSALTDASPARRHPRSLGAIDAEPNDSTQQRHVRALGGGRRPGDPTEGRADHRGHDADRG